MDGVRENQACMHYSKGQGVISEHFRFQRLLIFLFNWTTQLSPKSVPLACSFTSKCWILWCSFWALTLSIQILCPFFLHIELFHDMILIYCHIHLFLFFTISPSLTLAFLTNYQILLCLPALSGLLFTFSHLLFKEQKYLPWAALFLFRSSAKLLSYAAV